MKAEFTAESTTESWQAPWVFTQLPKTSKLLFTFILAPSCKLAFSASHSKSYPLILFLQLRVGVQSRSGSQFSSFSVLNCVCALTPSAPQRACLCLFPPPSTVSLWCWYYRDLMTECKKYLRVYVYLKITNLQRYKLSAKVRSFLGNSQIEKSVCVGKESKHRVNSCTQSGCKSLQQTCVFSQAQKGSDRTPKYMQSTTK